MSTTSTFFNNFDHNETQTLLDDLTTEAIRIHGQDCYYIPRRRESFDQLFSEDDTSYFDTAYQIPMYVLTAEGFLQNEAVITQFGLEVRPEIKLAVGRLEFDNEISTLEQALNRPREGDLVYFPLNKRTFQINFVDDKPFFYQHGKLQVYDLTCELYEYSNERFETGITEIDEIQSKLSFNAYDHGIIIGANGEIMTDHLGNIIVRETLEGNRETYDALTDNVVLEDLSDREGANTLIDWDESNPFASGRY